MTRSTDSKPLRTEQERMVGPEVEKIFNASVKRLGMNQCPEAIDYLYERYYNNGRCPRASDCRDLLEIVQAICRFRRQPVQLTRDLMIEAATTFICEF